MEFLYFAILFLMHTNLENHNKGDYIILHHIKELHCLAKFTASQANHIGRMANIVSLEDLADNMDVGCHIAHIRAKV